MRQIRIILNSKLFKAALLELKNKNIEVEINTTGSEELSVTLSVSHRIQNTFI